MLCRYVAGLIGGTTIGLSADVVMVGFVIVSKRICWLLHPGKRQGVSVERRTPLSSHLSITKRVVQGRPRRIVIQVQSSTKRLA